MRHVTSTGLVLGLLALGSTACSIDVRGESIVARDEKRFAVSGEPELSLNTFDGSIEVRSWDQKDVRIEIERRGPNARAAAALVVNVKQTGNRIVIEAPSPSGRNGGFHFGSWSSGSVSLIVTTPARVTLDASTGDGSIATEGLAGTLALKTGDGSIRVARVDGRVKAHTGDGSIRISDAIGLIDADTGDGAIDLAGRLEGVNIRTGDGSIRIAAEKGSVVASDWSVTTGDGAIDLRVPATLDAELDAHTGDGQVAANGLEGLAGDRRDERHTLRGRLGDGGHTLRLRSGDGSIVIASLGDPGQLVPARR
jgi:DUF4097 and DUF4098 domain-containing protein YvlB